MILFATIAIVAVLAVLSLVVARLVEPFLSRHIYPVTSDEDDRGAWLRFPAAIALGVAAIVAFGLLSGCSSREPCQCRCCEPWYQAPSVFEVLDPAKEPSPPPPEQPIEGVDQAELDAFYDTVDDSLRSLELIKRTIDGMISDVESR